MRDEPAQQLHFNFRLGLYGGSTDEMEHLRVLLSKTWAQIELVAPTLMVLKSYIAEEDERQRQLNDAAFSLDGQIQSVAGRINHDPTCDTGLVRGTPGESSPDGETIVQLDRYADLVMMFDTEIEVARPKGADQTSPHS